MTSPKLQQRAAYLKARLLLDASAAAQAATTATAYFLNEKRFHSSPVAGYVPMRAELDVLPLLAALGKRGAELSLPVVEPNTKQLSFRGWRPGEVLATGPFGIEQPPHTAPLVTPSLLLVPLVAYDHTGHRLGYGGGYYDNTIHALRAAKKPFMAVGVAYAMQESELPLHAEDFDERLDAVVTERGVTFFNQTT